MAEKLLKNILSNHIALEKVLKWIDGNANEHTQDSFSCSTGEFVSYFLNYVHEEAPCFNRYNDTPQKVHTPKSIRKLETPRSRDNKIKKRPALFSTPKSKTNESAGSEPHEFEGILDHSTPRANRTSKLLLNEMNNTQENCMSPVSPIHSYLGTPKGRHRNPSVDRSICLGDFLTQRKNSSKKKQRNENAEPQEVKKQRRINPTNLSQRRFDSFGKSENCFSFNGDVQELSESDEMISTRKLPEDSIATTPSKHPLRNRKEILPNLECITNSHHLDQLINIYVYCLEHNLVLNVTSEVYFMISLILSKQYETDVVGELNDLAINEEVKLSKIFVSIHNTVYFGIKTLERYDGVLKLLDKTTLKLLFSNERIQILSQHLVANIKQIYDSRNEDVINTVEGLKLQVSFISDTDNRENFPTEASFHAFKKQRDMFYEIIRLWEHNRLSDGWNFSLALGGRVRSLVNLHSDSANFRHFARLFKLQLLSTCCRNNEESLPEVQMNFLTSIPNVDTEKLNRLKNRLVTKTASNGINALPSFPGHQEFYRDFIVIASQHILNTHLKEAFVSELLELNDSKFEKNELEEEESTVHSETKRSYLICIQSMRLIAKFMGFLESYPHRQTYTNISDKILSAEITVRSWERPQFDLKGLLKSACENRCLVLMIPWITKYLSMLDYVTLRLPYYQSVLELLFEVFLNPPDTVFNNAMLIKLCLGWLIELPHFPSENYFIWSSNKKTGAKHKVPDVNGLDCLNIVDNEVIYTCCPYLNEYKHLLRHHCTTNNSINIKHITPVTALETPLQFNEKKLKLQLQEAFLNSQPVSMRKTVEFVSERIASACVKTICNRIVPEAKEKALAEFKQFLKSYCSHGNFTNIFKMELKAKCEEFLQEKLQQLQKICDSELDRQAAEKLSSSVQLLLAEEELKQTKEACAIIATRMCRTRVEQWVNMHVNANVFSKDFNAEVEKILSGQKSKHVKNGLQYSVLAKSGQHKSQAQSASRMLGILTDLCVDVMETLETVTEASILRVVDSITQTMIERCDINESMLHQINRTMLDLMILLISKRSNLVSSSVISAFVTHWKTNLFNQRDLFTTIISARNVHLLSQSNQTSASWSSLADFISCTRKEGLLNSEDFETQCVTIYQQNWNHATLKHLSQCFQQINNRCKTDSNFVVDFLSDFCADMDEPL